MSPTRRQFLSRTLQLSGGLAAVLYAGNTIAYPRRRSPNDQLNIAAIGVGNKGKHNIDEIRGENWVAFCDVDTTFLDACNAQYPGATLYRDYRKLFDEMAGKIDAVVVSTADHTHAPATSIALSLGKHVYCEKPLTHTVAEARTIARLASGHKVATQMGIQIHAEPNYRRVVELIRSGAIGTVREVYNWCNKGWSDGRFVETPDRLPAHLDWDLWLGPSSQRPFCSDIHPANWRRFWEFGTGTFGDMACHIMDLPFWALDLQYPTSVSATGPEVHPDGAPAYCMASYEFPRAEGGPLKFHWADGGSNFDLVKQTLDHSGKPLSDWGLGVLFVGDNGLLAADYGQIQVRLGSDANSRREGSDAKLRSLRSNLGSDPLSSRSELASDPLSSPEIPSQLRIPDSIGHWNEWLNACKTGSPTTCDFAYSGRLTETVLLGTVAYRSQQPFTWDPSTLIIPDNPLAQHLLTKEYRPGFEVVGLGRGD